MSRTRIQASAAVLALSGRTTEGARSLLIGEGLDRLAEVLHAYGGRTISLRPEPPRSPVRPGVGALRTVEEVSCGLSAFSPESFDSVFLVGPLPFLAHASASKRSIRGMSLILSEEEAAPSPALAARTRSLLRLCEELLGGGTRGEANRLRKCGA
jgi:hypothetical protein